jgi:hypothetical protein
VDHLRYLVLGYGLSIPVCYPDVPVAKRTYAKPGVHCAQAVSNSLGVAFGRFSIRKFDRSRIDRLMSFSYVKVI